MQLNTVLLEEVVDPESSVREVPESTTQPTMDQPDGSFADGNAVGLAVDVAVGAAALPALNTLNRQSPPHDAHPSPVQGDWQSDAGAETSFGLLEHQHSLPDSSPAYMWPSFAHAAVQEEMD